MDGVTIQISTWWFYDMSWDFSGFTGFSIHIWWGSTLSGCERIVGCTGRVDLTQLLACCSHKGYTLTANFMEHWPWFIDTFPSIYIYKSIVWPPSGICTCTCKINPNSCSHGTSGIIPVNTLCNCVWYYHIYYERHFFQYQTTNPQFKQRLKWDVPWWICIYRSYKS